MELDRLKTLWPEIEPLLDQLLELDEPERSLLLDRALAGSPDTRRMVEALLRADRATTGPLEHMPELPDAGASDRSPAAACEPGTRIGPYVVRRHIGHGGMGTVVRAERDDGQFLQRVAIKLIRPDALTPHARERFLLERSILARLEHPHIARLLDGGVREDGSPYLVMEYIEGQPITAWCDQQRLPVRARLQLFRQACDAVEYAHRQLVIHRDLKPDNILVTGQGDVKLLDFGIAKLLESGVESIMTGTQARVFTPAYATPEQYLGGPFTVASDEYQLALVLYELLTGQRAYGDRSRTPLEHQRAVLESEPARPSSRSGPVAPVAPSSAAAPLASESALAAAPVDGPSAAEVRSTTAPGLARELAGDLDAIVLKALEREPPHRYPSVEAFRRDLEAVLDDRPVAARRATTAYRLRKYVRRHRAAALAGALIALSVLAGVVGVLFQSGRAARERDLARASEQRAQAINDFVLRELLLSPTPERTLGRPLTVAEVLANATRAVEHAFPDRPATEAAVRVTLARSYEALGRLDAAREQAEAADRLLAGGLPADARERLEVRALLAELALDEGHAEDGQKAFEQLAADQARVLGSADPSTLRSRGQIGRALSAQTRWVPADSVLRGALAALPPGDATWRLGVELRGWLAGVWIGQSRATAAESLLRECVAIERRQVGSDHPMIVSTLRQLAIALDKDLRPAESGVVLRDVLRLSRRLYGEDHPATADAWSSLAANLDAQLHSDSALTAITQAVVIYRKALGDEHPKTLRAIRNQAVLLRGLRQFARADSAYQEVYRTCLRTLGAEHWQTIEALRGLNILRLDEGRPDAAREMARRVVATYERIAARPNVDPSRLSDYAMFLIEVEPADVQNPQRAVAVARRAVDLTQYEDYVSLRALGFAQAAAGEWRAAITSLNEALALPEGVRSWTTEARLVELLTRHGAPGELERVLLARIETLRRVRGPDDRYIAKTLRHLSQHELANGRLEEGERDARASLTQLLKSLPESHWEVGRARSELGEMLVKRGAYDEAEGLLLSAYQALEDDPEIPTSDLEAVRGWLVRLYTGEGRTGQAAAWRGREIPVREPRHD